MNKHDFEKHPIAIGQVWKCRDGEEITIKNTYCKESGYFCDYSWSSGIFTWTSEGVYDLDSTSHDLDLVELIYDPNIVASPKEYIPKFNRNEILQAILDDKPILFRVDEGETWQEVKDNDWVLRMIADKTEYCFKVKPEIKELFMIYNIYSATGQMKTKLQCEELDSGDTQVKYIFEDGDLVAVELVNGVCI